MKQYLRFIALPTITVFLFACSKSSVTELAATGTSVSASQQSALAAKKIVSAWNAPTSYYLNADRLGNLSIVGEQYFNAATQPIYDKASHVELVYTRIPGTVDYQYMKLAFGMSNRVMMKYTIDTDAFRIYLANADYPLLYDSYTEVVLNGWQFRYVIIPRSQYENTDVEWSDYLAVASILQIAP